MNVKRDPFVHHPELRDKVIDPNKSYFRTFQPADLDKRMRASGGPKKWRMSDAEREASRKLALAGHLNGDLWVFAYGSLMWDPGFQFEEVRLASVAGYARQFCLKDDLGGRGTPNRPGLMAALDEGNGCTGLAFRIAAEQCNAETEILWRREMLTGAYIPKIVHADCGNTKIVALTFVANHRVRRIKTNLTRAMQVQYIATGKGFRGSSLGYIQNLAENLTILGIDDQEVFSLLQDAEAYAADEHNSS